MRVDIHKVGRCKNGAYGNFILRGRHYALITVSLKKNPMLAEYGLTMLHELLHLWTTMLRREGFKMTNKLEHDFIIAVEDKTLETMREFAKRGNK